MHEGECYKAYLDKQNTSPPNKRDEIKYIEGDGICLDANQRNNKLIMSRKVPCRIFDFLLIEWLIRSAGVPHGEATKTNEVGV